MRQWSSQIRKGCIIHSKLAWHSLLFCETWRSHTDVEDYTLSTTEGLQTFRWNEVPSSSTVGPEDEGKLTSRQGETSQMTWIFTNTTENFTTTNCCPETSARNYQSTLRKIPKERRPHLHRIWSLKPCNCGSVNVFCYQHAKRMHRQVGRVFSLLCWFTCMLVISDVRRLSLNR